MEKKKKQEKKATKRKGFERPTDLSSMVKRGLREASVARLALCAARLCRNGPRRWFGLLVEMDEELKTSRVCEAFVANLAAAFAQCYRY